MQVLSNALPGVRDVRAPLIAGYIWLLCAWLIATPDINHRPNDQPGAALWDLADDVGRFGVALAVSVVAYLIGSVSQEASDAVRKLVRDFHRDVEPYGDDEDLSPRISVVGTPEERDWARIRLVEEYMRGSEAVEAIKDRLPEPEYADFRKQLTNRIERSAAAIDAELDLPATLLVGEQEQLFAEVDRLKSEADLRLTVAAPLLALVVLMALNASPWWLIAAPCLLVLVRQGLRREGESRKVMGDALGRAVVQSSALAGLSDAITTFVERVERRAAS
jgi:hypothetical protein